MKICLTEVDTEYLMLFQWQSKNNYRELTPYFLKTDEKEINVNEGNILFENFYQETKVKNIIYDAKFLWFEYNKQVLFFLISQKILILINLNLVKMVLMIILNDELRYGIV